MEVKNSIFLDYIIEKAKQSGDKDNSTLTSERLIVALIEYLTANEIESEYKDEAQATFKTMKFFIGPDWGGIHTNLLAYINGSANFLVDGISMQKNLMTVKKDNQKNGVTVITTEDVVKSIFKNPSEAIKSALSIYSDRDEVAETASNELKSSLEKTFDQLFEAMDIDVDHEEFGGSEKKHQNIIAELSIKVKNIQDSLLNAVYGQDNAISVFASGYFQSELLSLTDKSRVRPRATYLFAGPPGVGKTFLAENIAKVLELPFARFDMSEYSDDQATVEFCGSDNVYRNGKAGNVTGFVESNPHCVILFDEIEKAHISVIHLFLQLLDAGRLRDNHTDTEVSFKDAIIIFTTNAGKQLYSDSDNADYSNISRKVVLKALSNDVNPKTGIPYFPAAICSRFASGNVVMFNHIGAHNLRTIAKREILRHISNFEKEIGLRVDIDERVFTALLLSEGGMADARTIRARAETFFNDELYELFRLLSSEKNVSKLNSINCIKINVNLPVDNQEIVSLFECSEEPKVLVFASDEISATCKMKAKGCEIVAVHTIGDGLKALKEKDIKLILIDPNFGKYNSTTKYLNIEDVESEARDFFWATREAFSSIPVYLVQTSGVSFNSEEKLSFTRLGIRGIIPLTSGSKEIFRDTLLKICNDLHQQESMHILAKTNKVLTFETAQSVITRSKRAEIKLFDFELIVAVEAEDSKNILSNVSKPNVKFEDVIGANDAKNELKYFVEYLKNPKKYLGTGVRAPRGVLLYGPPGTGKTMLAKAMASESNVTFISAEGNQFLKRYLGEGQAAVHELFKTARKYAPSILFIDEIDAIAKERRGADGGNNDEETLTAFLTEMDGFKNDSSKPVFVLAATNFDVEPGRSKSLDPALMRRFDRKVYIDLPNREDRIKYIKMKMASNKAFAISESEIENVAMRSTGMSLAELESVIELSLRSAIRNNSETVTDDIFEEAFETYNSGDVKKWDMSQLERVARHETGHAFMCWHSGETPSYLTIVARGNHGGYMQHADNEGKAIYTKEELLAKIRTALGGRAAEIVYYGEKDGVSTGASGDLASATSIAQQIVCTYGMDEDFGLAVVASQAYQNGDLSPEVRNAVNKILSCEMNNAIQIISENKNRLDEMVEVLLLKNHLTGDEISEVFGKEFQRNMTSSTSQQN